MNNRYGIVLLSAICCIGCMFLHCMVDLAGGGTEDVNTRIVMGKIYRSNNQPAFYTQVKLIPGAYDPVAGAPLGDSMTDTTDSNGAYSLKAAGPGVYNIVAVDIFQRTRLLIAGVTVQGRITVVPPDSLAKPGAIKAFLPDTIDTANGYLYVPGTNIAVSPGGNGFVIIDSIPAGVIPALDYAVTTTAVHSVIRYAVRVIPEDTAVIFMPGWKYTKQLVLNTSASGAGVAGDVLNFPVLVRLSDGNFTFVQVQGDSSDLRFTKSDGTPLPYEIERWDPVGGHAEIWVKIDTVQGSSSSPYFLMYWGNTLAGSMSKSTAVFDTANGFGGVWHFVGPHPLLDATPGRNDLTDFHTAVSQAGAIGSARAFNMTDADGPDSLRAAGLLGMPSRFTISAWVKPHVSDSGSGTIISIGDYAAITVEYTLINGFYHYAPGMTGWRNTSYAAMILNNGWHYVSYSADPGTGREVMYLDGIQVSSTAYADSVLWTGLGSNTLIGTHGNGKTYGDYDGLIDEVRFEKAVRPADWIRLSYMNQKTPDALVVFK